MLYIHVIDFFHIIFYIKHSHPIKRKTNSCIKYQNNNKVPVYNIYNQKSALIALRKKIGGRDSKVIKRLGGVGDRAGIIYNVIVILISTIKLWISFLAFIRTLQFKNLTINKEFTRTFVNKHKMSRISDQTITKVPIIFLIIFKIQNYRKFEMCLIL